MYSFKLTIYFTFASLFIPYFCFATDEKNSAPNDDVNSSSWITKYENYVEEVVPMIGKFVGLNSHVIEILRKILVFLFRCVAYLMERFSGDQQSNESEEMNTLRREIIDDLKNVPFLKEIFDNSGFTSYMMWNYFSNFGPMKFLSKGLQSIPFESTISHYLHGFVSNFI